MSLLTASLLAAGVAAAPPRPWWDEIGIARVTIRGEAASGWGRPYNNLLAGPSADFGVRIRSWLLLGGSAGGRVATLGSNCHYGGCSESGPVLEAWTELQPAPRSVFCPWARATVGFYTYEPFAGADFGFDLRASPVALGAWVGPRAVVNAEDPFGFSFGLRLGIDIGSYE